MMGFGGIIWIVLIIAAVLWFFNMNKGKGINNILNQGNEDSLDILKKRYANGEISKEEYHKIKNDLVNT
ncbi:MAG: SHOCT domain-containing protein [Melioribacteraceae bacterium]|nr:SHOCT domain-containing protein [Melioribacteraceae bacterium]